MLNIKTIKEDDILKELIKCYYKSPNKYEDVFKFGREEFVLGLFNKEFMAEVKSHDELPELFEKLIYTYFMTTIKEVPQGAHGKFLLTQRMTNVHVFVDNIMHDDNIKEYFEKIACEVEEKLGVDETLSNMGIENYITSDAFEIIDRQIVKYIANKLINGGLDYNVYREYIDERRTKYWFKKFENEYELLNNAINLLEKISSVKDSIKVKDISEFAEDYANNFSDIDAFYRKVYFYFDNIKDKDIFIPLRDNIENVYLNVYIEELSGKWATVIESTDRYDVSSIVSQRDFYKNYIKPQKNRVVVIVSDAFRYECAKELYGRLVHTEKENECELSYMQGLVPSYTKLGMASLLPNTKLERVKDSDDILVDGKNASSTKARMEILQSANEDSIAITYSDLYEKTKIEWQNIFKGKQVIYIYHNTIDKAGESSESNVFDACNKAIDDLELLINDLDKTFSGILAFITADHGFFYRRSKIETYEKVDKNKDATNSKTRWYYSDNKSNKEGELSVSLDYLFGENSGYVNIPKGNSIFKRQGTGVNFVHGGILPQEVIIPVIEFKTTRNSNKAPKVGITYNGNSKKITNSVVYLEFLQDTNVDKEHRPARYTLYFVDTNGKEVSDKCTIIADYENTEVKDRRFRERFTFKNIKYDRKASYFLIIEDEETGKAEPGIQFTINIAIQDIYGF